MHSISIGRTNKIDTDYANRKMNRTTTHAQLEKKIHRNVLFDRYLCIMKQKIYVVREHLYVWGLDWLIFGYLWGLFRIGRLR